MEEHKLTVTRFVNSHNLWGEELKFTLSPL